MNLRTPALAPLALLAMLAMLALGSCGGGGGGDGEPPPPAPPEIGVFTDFKVSGNLDWESTGGSDGGVGDGGADGDGGVGAGGDFGQFRGANACVFLDNGTQLGCALTDNVKGMVTIKPGREYKGGLRIELSGTPTATYYEEGRDTYVPFPADRKIRVWVPAIARNIGVTPFTEAAYRLLTEGTAPESVGSGTPTRAQIRAANERVRLALNEHFPTALHVDDIARLPFIKSQGLAAGSMRTDPRGRYGLVNGAFSKQASFHNGDSTTPTLDAVRQLAEDLLDGRIDGRNGDQPAGAPGARTYDPNTLTGELSSALAEQAARFGAQEALDVLPKVLNFGNVRYEGYLFDGSISKAGNAFSTVAGWVAGNSRGLVPGQQFDRLPGQRALALYANNGHGGGFYKADANGPRHKVYAIGDNVNGELGLGTRTPTVGRALELSLPGAMTHAVGGFAHTVMRMADGHVYAWGDNSFGQLGQGQGPDTLPNSLSPLRVSLPRMALAVAATNTASYALLDDGSVWAWGSNGGFGLLGNGARDGIVTNPAAVAGLMQVVQISARDNDVVVVKRDNTVWHWGSFPADEGPLIPGDVTRPYVGGKLTPVQVAGMPANVAVRKVLTEQGLFVALLANGHAYHWGVHFDLSADEVLRDLSAQRIFGLPPVRDLMPGGFFGYGKRPFDRLTAMAVDYSGGMWKVRGRVAERFEPENPAAQRRPPGTARPDCENCHTFLDESIEQLRARQPSTAGMPVCEPPPNVHALGGQVLIHAETECIFCHNPSRANYPGLAQPFASNGFWPNCSKPTTLLPRTAENPPLLNNSCSLPPGHSFTPPGTVCASCHNSVIARPLQSLQPACAQPLSGELPTVPTTASITGALASPGGAAITAGGATAVRRYELRGSLSAALASGQALEVLRNGTVLGQATASGTAWTFSPGADAADGLTSHVARVTNGSGGSSIPSAVFAFTVDTTAPAAAASITGFSDDVLGAVPIGGFASDTTPMVSGTLSAPLGAGEVVQVVRDAAVVGTALVTGLSWSFEEPAALAPRAYGYQARAADALGNVSAITTVATLNIVTSAGTATITQISNDVTNVTIPPGGATTDSTPRLAGTVSGFGAGQLVRIRRDGVNVGTATVSGSAWTYTEAAPVADGAHTYSARVEAGAIVGAESSYAIVIDTVAPTQAAVVTGIFDDFNVGALPPGGTTADATPRVAGTVNPGLDAGAGEFLRLLRNDVAVGSLTPAGANWSYDEPAPLGNGTYRYRVQVVDAAGQATAPSAERVVVVDLTSVPLQGALTTLDQINGAAPAAFSSDSTPTLSGTVSRALDPAEVVRVYRNNTPLPTAATVNNTLRTWSFTNTTLADGAYQFRARIEVAANPAAFGQSSATVAQTIDTAAPGVNASVTAIYNNSAGLVAVGGSFTNDTTPRIDGTISGAGLGTGELVRLLRNGTPIVTLGSAGATTWSYTEPVALGAGLYTYSAVVLDSAANVGPATGATLGTTVVTSVPAATISTISVSGAGSFGKPDGTPVGNGGAIPDLTPTATVSIVPPMPAGYLVSLLRDGVSVGTATGCGGSCAVTDSGASQTQSSHTYTARVEAGTVIGGSSGPYTVTVDTVPPPALTISAAADNRPFQNVGSVTSGTQPIGNGGTTGDPDPLVTITLPSGTLPSGEQALLYRSPGSPGTLMTQITAGGFTATSTQPAVLNRPASAPSPTGNSAITYTARRIDAAGNLTTSTFTVNIAYQLCDSARAVSIGGANGTHNAATFPGGALTCVSSGCHTNQTTAGGFTFVAAPRADPGGGNWYWCRRN